LTKKCFVSYFFADSELPDYDPFDRYDVELLMLGWRGFNIESIKRFIKRCREDPVYRKKIQDYYQSTNLCR